MEDVEVSSWNELQDRLYEESWDESLQRFRPTLAFRGLAGARDGLMTSLARLGGSAEEVERPLLRNFRKYAGPGAVHGDSEWDWLALAQHHGLPTRLLDWSFSPFVALHFATANPRRYGEDGVVWSVDYVQAHRELPEPLRALLREERSDLLTTEMLSRAAPSLRDFDGLADRPFAAFFEPPALSERILTQSAIFSVVSNPSVALADWLRDRPALHRRIIVPAKLKWEVRDKLDQANVTERGLFPGLDGLSRWLARYYAPRDDRG